ncbi:MAG: hypothetical protein JW395_3152 [Nitrospira sp.]|nr:hypothetical protein [Nitrospira sp.]
MWQTKGCPKCNGDLFEEKLLGDSEIRCLQCGYVMRPQDLLALREALRARAAQAAPARRVKVPQAA